ncbi:MAG: hypothetical protein AB8V06_04190 [Francisella endosymbiont of Hyalomma asiaticum]
MILTPAFKFVVALLPVTILPPKPIEVPFQGLFIVFLSSLLLFEVV